MMKPARARPTPTISTYAQGITAAGQLNQMARVLPNHTPLARDRFSQTHALPSHPLPFSLLWTSRVIAELVS